MPLVTAVCPTRDRPAYVAKAIRCFFSQTFFDSELLILDDGCEACFPIVPRHPRIRYEYGQPGTWANIGEKRNAANELADGEIIYHADDDDWSAPERMEEQVALLDTSGAQLVGYSTLLYYRPSDGGMFKYRYAGIGHYAVGTSQCYRRAYWKANPFPSLAIAEDSQFSFRAAAKSTLQSVPGFGKIVARSLPNSTAKPNLGDFNFPVARPDEFPQAFIDEEIGRK